MAIPSNPAPEFCAACGFPLRGPRCEACGVDRTPSVGRRAGHAADFDGYDGDLDAWRTRDPVRFVGYCVGAEAGASVQPTPSGDGVGWIFPLRSVTLFVGLDAAAERLAIDAPLARVPERQRVPVLRACLELCDAATPARICLRDDLLLLRRVARVSAVTPAALRQALRGSAEQAERLVETLTSWFDARPAFNEEQRGSLTWAAAGRARPLKSFSIPPAPPRSLPPGPPSQRSAALPPLPMAPLPMPSAPPLPSRLGAEPAWAAPAPPKAFEPTIGAPGRAPHGAPSAPGPESTRGPSRDAESIPDILSPLLAASADPPSSKPAPMVPQDASPARSPGAPTKLDSPAVRAGAAPPRPAAAPPPSNTPPNAPSRPAAASPAGGPSPEVERRNAPTVPFRRSTPHMDAIAPPPVSSSPMSTPPVSVRPPAMPELDAEQLARQSASARADQARSPADRFCQLLRDAQALATALSFQDRASVMVILIRSTVFRAIQEHGDALPSAVAHLYRSTLAATRDLGQAEGAQRRPNLGSTVGAPGRAPHGAPSAPNPVSIAEPALLVLERIVSARGQVPEEKPLQIDPLTSAAHAREHLSGYLREIERAPAEPALRHFLALGALSELLVRAKLPAKTDQRLREIVAYAHRDGPRQQAIDLMMTALKKIVAQ